MDSSDEALAVFNKVRLQIRGVQVTSEDLAPLQKGRRLKILGTALNTVGALIQQVAEKEGNSDFTIFSSFLGPLISRKLP